MTAAAVPPPETAAAAPATPTNETEGSEDVGSNQNGDAKKQQARVQY